ncbi:MAG: GlmU family protein [Bacteroidales bacterium]|nr:GlmU family protein [Bacteroidales bacterium]MCF8337776.1 GlmU family protein [Bacteroidales bacterium]
MNTVLFDDSSRDYLLPLTYMRPISEIRVGILTIREKWEHYLNTQASFLTEPYLSKKFPIRKAEDNILINGSILPNPELVESIKELKPKQALVSDNYIIAIRMSADDVVNLQDVSTEEVKRADHSEKTDIDYFSCQVEHLKIDYPWHIFKYNDQAIENDFNMLTHKRKSARISRVDNTISKKKNVFLEPGAKVNGAFINAEEGPVYIGRDAEVMEGAMIRGPIALCNNAKIKMGAKIYGPATIGPYSKVGGEFEESVIFGYTNKAHEGFIGHSVIAEWCNLGADTNTSNLKNTYQQVRLYSYPKGSFVQTGEQFIGLIMGDHSKCGINTMFNTGTVIGVNANIFGEGFQRNYVPSFAWGGKSGYKQYLFDKAVEVAETVYKRRGKTFDETEKEILKTIFDNSEKFPT